MRLAIRIFVVLSIGLSNCSWADAQPSPVAFVEAHCAACHGENSESGLDLLELTRHAITDRGEVWERVLRKVSARQMPPEGEAQPTPQERQALLTTVSDQLDAAYSASPVVGKTEPIRRLNRTEYQYAIRDLLGIDIDATAWLPPDESSHGFDNITVSDLSPTYLNRLISAAQKISHLSVGSQRQSPVGETYRVRPDVTQEEHMPGLPLGTRGGTLIHAHFAQPGRYEISVRLARDRNEEVEGLYEKHELEILLDRQRVDVFTVEPPPGRRDFSIVDQHLKAYTVVSAGSHDVGVTFIKKSGSLLETKRQPYSAHYNMHRHPRLGPAVYEVSITGPLPGGNDKSLTPETESEIYNKQWPLPPADASPSDFARQSLRDIMRRAYRRPITPEDLAEPMSFFLEHSGQGYHVGIERALSAILVSPNFLLKLEATPTDVSGGTSYRISDLELATRMAFFLWSSLPDEQLLDLAESGRLREPEVLSAQVARMLRDQRSHRLVDNFAEQWLYLRNLESVTPDLRLFPDFDDNLRQAFRQETKLCFENVMREDRSVLELLKSDVTFLNERLAAHYRIPHIYGSRFRRVDLRELEKRASDNRTPPGSQDPGAGVAHRSFAKERGGLLRHGSILTVTSYATRTSPVLRGHWVLKNIVGSPPPPPPADVPALKDNTVAANLSMRQRLAKHRAHAACASCHNLLDPVGFALENFDAVGRWRDSEEGMPIDVTGGLSGMPTFQGVEGLEQALLAQPELFVSTMAEKLLTFAVGRGVEACDGPAIRRIVKSTAQNDYRFSSLIEAIVLSPPFQMRIAQ